MSDILHDLYVKGFDAVVVVLLLWGFYQIALGDAVEKIRKLLYGRESTGAALSRLIRWPYPTPVYTEIDRDAVRRAAERGDVGYYQHKYPHQSIPR